MASGAEEGVSRCWGHTQMSGSTTRGLRSSPRTEESPRGPCCASPGPAWRQGKPNSTSRFPGAQPAQPGHRGRVSPKRKQTSLLKKGISLADQPADNHTAPRPGEPALVFNENLVLPGRPHVGPAASLLLSLPCPRCGTPPRWPVGAWRRPPGLEPAGWRPARVPRRLCSHPPGFSKLNLVNGLARFSGSSQTIRYNFPL